MQTFCSRSSCVVRDEHRASDSLTRPASFVSSDAVDRRRLSSSASAVVAADFINADSPSSAFSFCSRSADSAVLASSCDSSSRTRTCRAAARQDSSDELRRYSSMVALWVAHIDFMAAESFQQRSSSSSFVDSLPFVSPSSFVHREISSWFSFAFNVKDFIVSLKPSIMLRSCR